MAQGISVLAITIISLFGFSEGVDYSVLEKPVPNADKTLINVFSYDCLFCFKHDKVIIAKLLKH